MWDVIVAGAGAAGLLAAIRAAERGRRTLLIEKNSRPGVKILMSGGTRCNITHDTDTAGIVEAFGPSGRFLYRALKQLDVRATVAIFEAEGVATKVENTGKIFPVSDRAADVLNALLRRLQRSGAELRLGEPLLDVTKESDHFVIRTPGDAQLARRIILTTGGMSYPSSGTTGDGYAFARQFGHTIVEPRPALTPVQVAAPWVAELRGVRVDDAIVRVLAPESSRDASAQTPPLPLGEGRGEGRGRSASPERPHSRRAGTQKPNPLPEGEGTSKIRTLAERRESLLFAHFGVTGPAALDVSRAVALAERSNELLLEVDFVPGHSIDELETQLQESQAAQGSRQVSTLLPTELPNRLATRLCELAGVSPAKRAAELSRDQRGRLVSQLKQLRLPITGTLGFKKAEVTTGGVSLDEVDPHTMQSRLCPGLYIAGEVLDLDGPIGGYNFQAAFSTGWLAGSNV